MGDRGGPGDDSGAGDVLVLRSRRSRDPLTWLAFAWGTLAWSFVLAVILHLAAILCLQLLPGSVRRAYATQLPWLPYAVSVLLLGWLRLRMYRWRVEITADRAEFLLQPRRGTPKHLEYRLHDLRHLGHGPRSVDFHFRLERGYHHLQVPLEPSIVEDAFDAIVDHVESRLRHPALSIWEHGELRRTQPVDWNEIEPKLGPIDTARIAHRWLGGVTARRLAVGKRVFEVHNGVGSVLVSDTEPRELMTVAQDRLIAGDGMVMARIETHGNTLRIDDTSGSFWEVRDDVITNESGRLGRVIADGPEIEMQLQQPLPAGLAIALFLLVARQFRA
ncbi:MAG: hypothetical protein H6837_09480 [Planctomycetes bacterium]|nr:hypothetical protein [Planctomycetota bacterium]